MKRIDQINVLPFIDIMLVLLAIVLTTATFIREGRLQIQLPASASQDQTPPPDSVEIAIDADGVFYLGRKAVTADRLAAALDALDPSTPIVVRVDAATRFERFVTVVDQLKARRLERLTILTRRS